MYDNDNFNNQITQEPTDVKTETVTEAKSGFSLKKVVLIAVLCLVAVVILNKLFLGGRKSYDTVVEAYVNAIIDNNAEKIAALMPEELIERSMSAWGISNKDYFIQEFIEGSVEKHSEHLLSAAEGEKSRIYFEIDKVDDFSEGDLVSLQKDWNDRGLKIEEAKLLEVNVHVKGSTKGLYCDLKVVKIGRSWYLWREMY